MDTISSSALTKQAEQSYRSGNYNDAARFYQQAAELWLADGEGSKHAELMNNSSVAHLQAGNAQAALDASLGTEKVFGLAGDIRSQALALGNQAAALEALNNIKEALARYRQCSDLLKQVGDDENRAYVLKRISSLQIRTGQSLEALASMNAALDHKKKLSIQESILKKLLRIPMDMLKRGR